MPGKIEVQLSNGLPRIVNFRFQASVSWLPTFSFCVVEFALLLVKCGIIEVRALLKIGIDYIFRSARVLKAPNNVEKTEPTLQDGRSNVMVLEILSHSGQVNHQVDPELSQLSQATNTRELE